MGAMRKMAVYLGLVEDDMTGYEDEPEAYDDTRRAEPARSGARREEPRYAAVRPVTPPRPPATRGDYERSYERPGPDRPADRSLDLREPETVPGPFDQDAAEAYRITTLHPRSYNDARRIGEEFRSGTPVIMNLTEMHDEDAKRIIDFSAGLIFGLHGSIDRVAPKVFLISPANVDVAAEARRLAQDGFFNQS